MEANEYGEVDCKCTRCGHEKQSLPFIICDNFEKCSGVYIEINSRIEEKTKDAN